MWQDEFTKSDTLPIEHVEYGYVQRSRWHQPDRLHEEVLELDSPFATTIAAGTKLFTFLLIGDQNAGKSTFIHSFGCHLDPSFLALQSQLPALATSFVNSRFLTESDPTPPIDELPFLDTDVARGSFVLTLEDFAFFVSERGLPETLVTTLPPDTRFCAVQFIEFGGDHLDRLMDPSLAAAPAGPSPGPGSGRAAADGAGIASIVARSRDLLGSCRKLVYFVNGAMLFPRPEGEEPCAVDESVLQRLLARLSFLQGILPESTALLAHMCRPPTLLTAERAARLAKGLGLEDGLDFLGLARATEGAQSPEALSVTLSATLFRALLHGHGARLPLCRAARTSARDHIRADGGLNVGAIMETLCQMFDDDMVDHVAEPHAYVLAHLLACFKQPERRVDEASAEFSVWLSQDDFLHYLDDTDFTEVPDAVMLQLFQPVTSRLAAAHLALLHHADGHADVRLSFSLRQPPSAWVYERAAEHAAGSDDGSAAGGGGVLAEGGAQRARQPCRPVRFPYHPGFLDAVAVFVRHQVPAELWLQPDKPLFRDNEGLRHNLERVAADLGRELGARWLRCCEEQTPVALHRWFWCLEEACQAAALLGQPGALNVRLPACPDPACWAWLVSSLGLVQLAGPGDEGQEGGGEGEEPRSHAYHARISLE